MGNSTKIHAKTLKVFIKCSSKYLSLFPGYKILIIWKIICDNMVAYMTNMPQ